MINNNNKTKKRGSKDWIKGGKSPNPNGRPKGSGNKLSIKRLCKAIHFVEEEERETFLIAWLRCSWGDAAAMNNIAHYYLPTKKAIEMQINMEESVSDEAAIEIQAAIKARCIMLKNKNDIN